MLRTTLPFWFTRLFSHRVPCLGTLTLFLDFGLCLVDLGIGFLVSGICVLDHGFTGFALCFS